MSETVEIKDKNLEVQEKVDKEIETLLTKAYKRLSKEHQDIIKSILRTGKIATPRNGKTKQWAQVLFMTMSKDILAMSEYSKKVIMPYIEKAEAGKKVYIHTPSISKKYHLFITSWLKINGFKKRGEFLIADEEVAAMTTPKKGLYDKIKKEGLPLILGKIQVGSVTRERMLYSIANESDWVVSTDGMMIIGSSKVSFIANYCHYQVKKNISIWKLYHFFRSKNPDYIQKQGIETVSKFLMYTKIRKSDIRCTHLKKFNFKFKNPDSGKEELIWDADFVVGTKEENEIKIIIARLVKKDHQ